jgi:hypothetical protein
VPNGGPCHVANSTQIRGFQVSESQDKLDAELEAQAEALVKRNGFGNLAEYDNVSMNIALVMSGIDQKTKGSSGNRVGDFRGS